MHSSDFRKIDLVCSDSDERPELQCVYLHEGHLYATDRVIAARLPAHPTDQDTDGPIPKQAIAIARGADSTITANEAVRVPARKCAFDRSEPALWPRNIDRLNEVTLNRPGPKPETHEPIITLDIRRLWTLAQSICKTSYGLEIYLGQSNHDLVLVKSIDRTDDALGAIMPMCLAHPPAGMGKADLWHALDQLKAAIADSDNGDSVVLSGDLLDELRKVLCVEAKE